MTTLASKLRQTADLLEERNLEHLQITWSIDGPAIHAEGELIATVLAALPELRPDRRIAAAGSNGIYIWTGTIGGLEIRVLGTGYTDDELATRGLIPPVDAA